MLRILRRMNSLKQLFDIGDAPPQTWREGTKSDERGTALGTKQDGGEQLRAVRPDIHQKGVNQYETY